MTRRGQVLSWIERAAWALGLSAALWVAGDWTVSAGRHTRLEQRLAAAAARPVKETPTTLTQGAPIGTLDIPRLNYSEAVAEGEAETILRASVGHLPDTPLPWNPGNSVLAGHRDRHFRALRAIRIDDEIRLRTPYGTLTYRVIDKMIVNPDDVWVMESGKRRRLTLVTCYPFTYLGNAPQRFVVRAEEQ